MRPNALAASACPEGTALNPLRTVSATNVLVYAPHTITAEAHEL